jgi:hypothetical protein
MKDYFTVKHKDGSYYTAEYGGVDWRGLDAMVTLFDSPRSAVEVAKYGDRVVQLKLTEVKVYDEGAEFKEGEIVKKVRS